MKIQIIESEKDIKRGVTALCKACPQMRAVHKITGNPPLRRHEGGFPGLARIIVGQQLSIASAAAIWARVEETCRPMSAQKLLKLSDERLKSAGLSAAKIRTLRALSEALKVGALDLQDMAQRDDEEIHAALTAIHGIGPWTADIYIMFCLGRADSWAPGDLALKHAVRAAMKHETLPTHEEMVAFAERWSPWRAIAARLLWAYYAALKNGADAEPLTSKRKKFD